MLSNDPPQTSDVHVLRWDTCGADVFRRSPEAPFQIHQVWSVKADETPQGSGHHTPKQTTEEVVIDLKPEVSPNLTPPLHTDEETSYICSECGKCIIGYSRFVAHCDKHDGKYLECKQCKLTFSHETYLNRHIATHTKLTPFRCTKCKLCFGKNSDLLLHQRVHRGEKPYQCTECEQSFTEFADLAVHEMIHDDEAPKTDEHVPSQATFQTWQKWRGTKYTYQCTFCVRSFTNINHLRRHERSHKTQKRIECPKCKETFRFAKELAEHAKTHAEHKPYTCSDCGAAFRLPAHRASHRRVHGCDL